MNGIGHKRKTISHAGLCMLLYSSQYSSIMISTVAKVSTAVNGLMEQLDNHYVYEQAVCQVKGEKNRP